LKAGFTAHLEETRGQVGRLDEVAELLGCKTRGKVCHAMKGLVEEGQEVIEEAGDPTAKDALLIAAAQKVEHYEMATYGCLRTWAEMLGEDEAVRLLQMTLDEEGATDKKLSEIAQSLNIEAAEQGQEEEPAIVTPGRRGGNGGRSSQKRSR